MSEPRKKNHIYTFGNYWWRERARRHSHTNTHAVVHTQGKGEGKNPVSYSPMKELTEWQIRVRNFWRRKVLGKGPNNRRWSLLIISSSIEYHLLFFHDDERPRRAVCECVVGHGRNENTSNHFGIESSTRCLNFFTCFLFLIRLGFHSNDMRFSASSEFSAGVSTAKVNKLSQSSMASGQTIRSL